MPIATVYASVQVNLEQLTVLVCTLDPLFPGSDFPWPAEQVQPALRGKSDVPN
jgi:hypothetical protein